MLHRLLVTLAFGAGCIRTLEVSDSGRDTSTDSGIQPETVCIPGETTGFLLPNNRWALATLFASRRFADLGETQLHLSPSWFLATAWERTAFGCDDYGAAWSEGAQWTGDQGCMGVHRDTVWIELSRLFPVLFDPDGYEGAVAGPHIEAGVMASAWSAYVGHAHLQRHTEDPDAWYLAAQDPLAVEHISALMHQVGVWSSDVATVLEGCGDDVVACLSDNTANVVSGVSEKIQLLDGAECHDTPITDLDIDEFTAEMARVWPEEDWSAAAEAAKAARTGEGFRTEGLAVVSAIESAVYARMACPEQELQAWYSLSCP
jgi:hypothetical protein